MAFVRENCISLLRWEARHARWFDSICAAVACDSCVCLLKSFVNTACHRVSLIHLLMVPLALSQSINRVLRAVFDGCVIRFCYSNLLKDHYQIKFAIHMSVCVWLGHCCARISIKSSTQLDKWCDTASAENQTKVVLSCVFSHWVRSSVGRTKCVC